VLLGKESLFEINEVFGHKGDKKKVQNFEGKSFKILPFRGSAKPLAY
jgi:hypothetical protein